MTRNGGFVTDLSIPGGVARSFLVHFAFRKAAKQLKNGRNNEEGKETASLSRSIYCKQTTSYYEKVEELWSRARWLERELKIQEKQRRKERKETSEKGRERRKSERKKERREVEATTRKFEDEEKRRSLRSLFALQHKAPRWNTSARRWEEKKIECRLSIVVTNGPECLFRYQGKRHVTRWCRVTCIRNFSSLAQGKSRLCCLDNVFLFFPSIE